jgi:hypothetical protein
MWRARLVRCVVGKNEYTSTERKANLLLQPRMRCWFGSECYRTGKDHLGRYTHPGEEDWVCKKVTLHLKGVTEKAVKDTARAFTKADGRRDFVDSHKAAIFLREYSGLPVVFLRKVASVVGGVTMAPKLRREQFAVAMQAVDAMQRACKPDDGNQISLDDFVFDGQGVKQLAAPKPAPRKSWVDTLPTTNRTVDTAKKKGE